MVTTTLPSNVLFGLHANGNARYIHYRIDFLNQVPEDDEANNVGVTPIDIIGLPDLEVIRVCLYHNASPQQCTDDPGYTPPTQTPGALLRTTYTILNNGVSRVPSFTIGIYFSTDAMIDTSDQLLVTRTSAINAGSQAFPNGFLITVPAGAAPGTAYLGPFADHDAQFPESNETNNTGAAALTVASGIDLTMASFTAPDAQGAGSNIDVSFEVSNLGMNDAGAFAVRFFYDDDADAGSGQTTLGHCNLSGVAGGGTSGLQTCTVPLSNNALFGARFIHYAIDANNAVNESDEANNTGAGGFQVTGLPDLFFTAFTASPSQLTPGQPTTVDYTFANLGFARTDAAFVTRLYYSDDDLLDTNTDDLLDSEPFTGTLDANAVHQNSLTVTIPATAAPSGGRLFGVVDADDAVTEENESDNTVNATLLLPVELTAFDAVLDGQAVLLHWATASETNNAGFEIQRMSNDNGGARDVPEAWDVLGFVEGHGTTEQPQAYSYRAEALAPGRHIFRLKQIDFDGAFAYSPEVEVTVELATAFLLTPAYPNPFNARARFTVAVRQAQHVRITVYDIRGHRLARLHDGMLDAHQAHTFTLDGSRWASGLYVYAMAGEHFRTTHTALLVK